MADPFTPPAPERIAELASALARAEQRIAALEQERDEARAIVHACDDAARGQAVSEFMASFVPVRQVIDLRATLARVQALREQFAMIERYARHLSVERQNEDHSVMYTAEANTWAEARTKVEQALDAVLSSSTPTQEQT